MEARIRVTRAFALLPVVLLALIGGCDRAREADEEGNQPITIDVPRASANQPGVTPMAQRVAVLGMLNKRNGIVRDLVLRPGQAMRVKDVTVRLLACETSAPWELEKLTGVFVQMDVKRSDGRWVRKFSGWLYKESPSLNVVEDPVYDVWPKSCAMSWPAGPEAPAAPAASTSRSIASKSGGGATSAGESPVANGTGPAETPPPAPADNAVVNNPT